jgi:H+/Cl- antiporter ClcA
VLAVATPALLLGGASVVGFVVGVAAWLVIRGLGVALERARRASSEASQQLTLWLGYRLARILVLAGAAITVREAVDENAGITVVAVIASAFTIQLFGSVIDRYTHAQRSAGASL